MLLMLVYLIKKTQVKVLNKSLVVPTPKMNMLMKNFRGNTIGHKLKTTQPYADQLHHKII